MSAKRFWEGHILKGGTEIGFGNGSFSVDRGLQTFYELGSYDLAARRDATREVTGTIEHGYISEALFGTLVTGAGTLSTFDIHASFAAYSIKFSGCSIESYDMEIPGDGWITETVNWRGKTLVKGY